MALHCIIHLALHHTNYLISTNAQFPLADFMMVTPIQYNSELNLIKIYHLTLAKETIEELLGEFALVIAFGKYLSLWGNYHLKELAEAGGLSD